MNQNYGTLSIAPAASISLRPGDLAAHGVAFITPATVTGQEEDRPALALVFTEIMAQERKDVRVVPLSQTLGAVGAAGLAEAYNRMISEFRDSGSLNRATLAQVSHAIGVRYIAQLRMAGFAQENQERFGVFGLRLFQTKKAQIRLFLRIWDGQDGSVAWEGAQELHLARETVSENAISFREVVAESAHQLIAKLP